VERSCVYAEHQGNSQHAFVAGEAGFEIAMAVDPSDQRDEVVGGKEDMTKALPGPGTHIAKAQLNLLAACQQMLTTRAGETGKQMTSRDGDDMNSLSRSGTNWFVGGAARTGCGRSERELPVRSAAPVCGCMAKREGAWVRTAKVQGISQDKSDPL
jgi:hypothetical protein